MHTDSDTDKFEKDWESEEEWAEVNHNKGSGKRKRRSHKMVAWADEDRSGESSNARACMELNKFHLRVGTEVAWDNLWVAQQGLHPRVRSRQELATVTAHEHEDTITAGNLERMQPRTNSG